MGTRRLTRADAATIIPWTMYQVYNDKTILKDQYSSMKAWVNYIRLNVNKENGLWQTGFQYGDWLSLDRSDPSGFSGATDEYLIASAYYLLSTKIVSESAKVLGYDEDYQEYQDVYNSTLKSFRDEYITRTGRIISETQTSAVVLLHFGLVETKLKERVIATLKSKIEKFNNHISTGFVGTPYILLALSDNDLHEIAAKLILQEEYPGWLYEVKNGSTTIWERWNGIMENGEIFNPAMNSFNHYAYGSIGEWMYRKVAGIDLLKPGYEEILIQPMIVLDFGAIEASYESIYGTISVQYHVTDNLFSLDVEIPCNTTAKVYLPNEKEAINIGSGKYHFEKQIA
jgi:alpha-L-rhamnosidase